MLLKSYLFSALFFISTLAISQSKSWIDASAGGYLAKTNLHGYDLVTGQQDEYTLVPGGKLAYNTQILPRLYVRAGVQAMSFGWESPKRTNLVWGTDIDSNYIWSAQPVGDPTMITEIQLAYHDVFIGLPVTVRYELLERRFTPYIEGGLMPSFFIKSRIIQKTNTGTSSKWYSIPFDVFNKFRVIANISVGSQYLLSPNLQVFAQPTFYYHLTPTFKSSPGANQIRENMYSVGLELGVRKALNTVDQ